MNTIEQRIESLIATHASYVRRTIRREGERVIVTTRAWHESCAIARALNEGGISFVRARYKFLIDAK